MATTIKLKNSVTTTNAPSSLVQGEVAINITDKKVWVGNAATTPIQLLGDGGSASFTSIAFGAGTVSNPSITFTGDTNTGIYSPAADTIAFTEGGVESMRIDSSGNVGIGTTNGDPLGIGNSFKFLSISGGASAVQLTSTGTNAGTVFGSLIYGGSNVTAADKVSASIRVSKDNSTVSNAAASMDFFVSDGTTSTNRMTITSSGNVGIGTSSPSSRLHVVGGTNNPAIFASSDATNSFVTFRYNTSTTFGYVGNGSGIAGGSSGDMAVRSEANLVFATGGNTERMRIDSSGNLLVGATSLATGFSGAVQIEASGSSGGIVINSTAGNICRLIFTKSNASGNEGLIRYDTNGYSMQFWTDALERMRITSGGALLVGTTAGSGYLVLNNKDNQNFGYGFNIQKNGNGNPNYELVVGGDNKLYLGYSATTTPAAIGNFATNGTYTATSDIRKKKDISYTFNGLGIVRQLKPVQGRMLDDEESSPLRPMFIAQDMVDVLPSVVSSIEPSPNTNNPLLGIDYSSIIPVLTKAIQEQQAMIEELKQEVAKLKGV